MGDGDVLRAIARVDAVGVARERVWRVGYPVNGVDSNPPHSKAISCVIGHVEVWRVAQCNAIEGEVVGVVRNDEAADLLAAAVFQRLFAEIPGGDSLPEDIFSTTPIDNAVAHYASP